MPTPAFWSSFGRVVVVNKQPIAIYVAMPTTTRRKRAADAATGTDIDDDAAVAAAMVVIAGGDGATADNNKAGDEIDEAEAALAAAQEVRKAKAKKRRLEAKQRLPRFEVLIEQGLMPLVVDLLSDNPKSLFSLYCVSKRSQPFITREVVVRASVYQGNNSREIMRDLIRRIEKRSIFLPSAIRLLRLINGRRCENLSECWGFNIRTQKHQNLATAHYTTRPFGLCLCKDCAKGLTTSVPTSSFAASHERVNDRTLDVPFYDSQGGRHGPVVTTRDVKQIEKSYRGADDRMAILNQILKEVDDEANGDEDAIIKSLVGVHKDAESKADAIIDARAQLLTQRLLAIQREKNEKKIARMKQVHDELSMLLEDFEHKELALKVEDWGARRVEFFCALSGEILSGLFSCALSALTKKKIRAAADEVRRVYNLAASRNLLRTSSDFLSFLSDRADEIEQAVYSYLRSEYGKTNDSFFFEEGDMKWLESMPTDAEIRAKVLQRNTDIGFSYAFAFLAVPDGSENAEQLRKLAEHCWFKAWDDRLVHLTHGEDEEDIQSLIQATREILPPAHERFRLAKLCLSEYLAIPAVIEFMGNADPPPNNPKQKVTRRHVVETIYGGNSFDLLLGRNYDSLLQLHMRMYDDPAQFWYLFDDLLEE